MTIRTYYHDRDDFSDGIARLQELLEGGGLTATTDDQPLDVPAIVSEILADLQAGGAEAICRLEKKLDRAELTPETLRVPTESIAAAHSQAEPEFLSLIRRAIANIREYQESILVTDPPPLVRGGRELSVRYTPVGSAGVYVPGGRALYPSTVLMTVVPAQVAGVGRIVMASPPTGGDIDPMVLALAGELGIDEVYRLGGAVAIGALAMGVDPVARVDKIVGPGNAFVAEAKRQVLGRVGIDSIAGPSEVLIVADETARADWIAADLIAQAEHNPGSAILVTTSRELARDVPAELEKQLSALDRSDAIAGALDRYSAIFVVADLARACDLANRFAAEHLQIVVADEAEALERIVNAGAIFVGPHTPVPMGDYYAGPSHVLPTGGTARFFGPLSCNDFRKASSVIRYDAPSLAADADDVIDFATREGLTAHARAVEVRRQAAGEQ